MPVALFVNGALPSPPLFASYDVEGTASELDHDARPGTIEVTDGEDLGELVVTAVSDADASEGEELALSLRDVRNVLRPQVSLPITDDVTSWRISIASSQDGRPGSFPVASGGPLLVTARVV
ncbi:MAG: hypothetical protein HC923_05565, partial [Myxococcales bacterium]|nr:hypothetical protein [Myxococcales bacterium]